MTRREGDKGYTVSLSQLVLFCKYRRDLFRIFRADGQGVRAIDRVSRLRACGPDAAPITIPKEPAVRLTGRAGVGKRPRIGPAGAELGKVFRRCAGNLTEAFLHISHISKSKIHLNWGLLVQGR